MPRLAGRRARACGAPRRGPNINVEILRSMEILHCAETFPSHRVFYFRATKSFHDNGR